MTPQKFDIERARDETRGCGSVIHLNNAGAALMPAPVCDALHNYLQQEEQQGGYETMAKQEAALDNFYRAAGRLLNCAPTEIAFTDSATRAWAMAFYSFRFQPGERILVGAAEYGSNLTAMLQQARKTGVEIVPVPDNATGQIDVAALERLIDANTRLICLTHIPSGNGLINPAAAVGRIAKAAGIPYLLDACQSLGQLPLDVEAIGCDLLCGTGRKYLRGPRGSGLLYVRSSLLEQLEPPMLNHHAAQLLSTEDYGLCSDAKRFECWERNCAGQVALGVAIDYAQGWGLPAIETRIKALSTWLRKRLAAIDGIRLTDQGTDQCGIVTFYAQQQSAEQLQKILSQRRINTSLIGYAANPYLFTRNRWPTLLRASLHYYNTEVELEYLLEVLQALLEGTAT